MNTEQLIRELSREVPRVSRHALARRVAIGLVAGGLASMVLVTLVLGVRPDLQVAMHGFSFWMKWTYTMSLGVGAAYGVARLSRPEPGSLRALWWLAAPVLVLAGIGIGELANAPPGQWLAMWLGHTWKVCPLLVLLLAIPIFIGVLWSFRRLAPTRLRAAGAVLCMGASFPRPARSVTRRGRARRRSATCWTAGCPRRSRVVAGVNRSARAARAD